MKTESLNKLFVELDIMFNTANSMDAFYHHFANAKMIFNHELGDEEKLKTEKPHSIHGENPHQLVMDFEPAASPINKETCELISAIYKAEHNCNVRRLRKIDEEWLRKLLADCPEIVKIARMGKRLYSAMRIFRNWEGQAAVQHCIYQYWKSGKATMAELDRFTNMNNRKNIQKLNIIVLKAYNEKDKKNRKVADFIDELFNAWKK